MKALISKILSVVLAVLVFLTTTSFIMDAHFCGDSLIDLAVIHPATSCGMHSNHNSKSCDNTFSKTDCCKDIQIISKGQERVQPYTYDLTAEQQFFVVSFIYTYVNLFQVLDVNIVPFKDYIPPLLVRDIHSIQEVYII